LNKRINDIEIARINFHRQHESIAIEKTQEWLTFIAFHKLVIASNFSWEIPTLFGITKNIYEKLNLVEIEKLFQVACTLLPFSWENHVHQILFSLYFFKAYYDDELCVFEVGGWDGIIDAANMESKFSIIIILFLK
jgi:hypothetical protein